MMEPENPISNSKWNIFEEKKPFYFYRSAVVDIIGYLDFPGPVNFLGRTCCYLDYCQNLSERNHVSGLISPSLFFSCKLIPDLSVSQIYVDFN